MSYSINFEVKSIEEEKKKKKPILHEVLLWWLTPLVLCIDGHAGKAMCGGRSHFTTWHEASCDLPLTDPLVFCWVGSNSGWEQPGIQWAYSGKIVTQQDLFHPLLQQDYFLLYPAFYPLFFLFFQLYMSIGVETCHGTGG